MHLYLSSFLLGSRSGDLATLVPTRKAAIVANALDHAASSVRRSYVERQILEFLRLGFEVEELDLRDYFNSRRDLSSVLDAVGLVWVTGGNSFLLRRAMKQSGFDAYILEHRASDRLVYGGFSAGACVAAPTLHGLDIVDDPEVCAEGYVNEVVWGGLGLVSYCIAPHFRSNHPESSHIDALVQYFRDNRLPFVTLRDGEVIVTVSAGSDNGDAAGRQW